MSNSTASATDQELDEVLAEASEDSSDESAEETNTEGEGTTEPEATNEPVTLESLKTQLEALSKQNTDAQAFIARQAQEIGELRKQKKAESKVEKPTREEFFENPEQATEKLIEAKRQEETEQAQTQQEQVETTMKANAAVVVKYVPKVKELLPDMLATLKTDGETPEAIETFKNQMLLFPPALVIQLAKRVEQEKRVKELEAKLAEAEGRPGQMLKKINEASKLRPVGGKGGNGSRGTLSRAQLAKMNDEQLDAILKGG